MLLLDAKPSASFAITLTYPKNFNSSGFVFLRFSAAVTLLPSMCFFLHKLHYFLFLVVRNDIPRLYRGASHFQFFILESKKIRTKKNIFIIIHFDFKVQPNFSLCYHWSEAIHYSPFSETLLKWTASLVVSREGNMTSPSSLTTKIASFQRSLTEWSIVIFSLICKWSLYLELFTQLG